MDINGNGNGKRTAEQPKRRACDECRGRKLACSKEVDGCARCKREGIKCVYSPQKRMGRPRKQRPLEAAEPQAEVSEPHEAPAKEVPPVIIPHFEFDSTIGMNLDFSFLDVSNTDVNFLDLVDPDSQFLPLPAQTDLNKTPPAVPKKTTSGSFWHMGTGSMGEINFDEPINPPSQSPGPEIITPEEALQITADIAETLPSLSPPPSSSPSTYASPAALDNVRTCGCLPALYLALDSLQTLPKEVGHAMLVARTAARTAHDTILCPVCGNPPFDPTSKPPMQAFQNLMMLGALLPSLSHAYMRILDMVDAEARAADAERRKIRFQLGAYGGMWGWMAKMDPAKCGATERLGDVMLDPILWRLTVRALLKLDVYGVNDLDLASGRAEVEQGLHQPGLKDIINMMEERSRQRHQQMDEMVAAGLIENIKCEYIPLSSGEKPTCMRIIDIAKKSMEDLIIP